MDILKKIKINIFKKNINLDNDLNYNIKKFLLDPKQNGVIQIIGKQGIGKTHFLYHLFNKLKDSINICFINNDNVEDLNTNCDAYFIDSYFEFNEANINKINDFIALNHNNKKIILTSWTDIDIKFKNTNIKMEKYYLNTEPNIEALFDIFDIDNIPESTKEILRKLTYRQIILILNNMKFKKNEAIKWDTIQKMYENIINKAKLLNIIEKNNWIWFKENLVLNNKKFPYISKKIISQENKLELLRLQVIQETKNGFILNNTEFLIPLIIRKYKKNEDSFEWIDNFISHYSKESWPILIWYFCSRNFVEEFIYMLSKNDLKIKGSLYSNYVLNLKIKKKYINLFIDFDKPFVLFDLMHILTDEEIIKIILDKKFVFIGNHDFPNLSSKKYCLDNRINKFKKIIIYIISYINNHNGDSIENSRLKNTILYKDEKYNFSKIILLINSIIPSHENIAMLTFIYFGFKEFGVIIFENNSMYFSFLKKSYYINENNDNSKTDLENFENIINDKLNKIENLSSTLDIVDMLFYHTHKSMCLVSLSTLLHKINKKYSYDKYKNTLLKQYILYIILFDQRIILQVEKLIREFGNKLINNQLNGSSMDTESHNKIQMYNYIVHFMNILLIGGFDSHYNATPYFPIYNKNSNQEIDNVFLKIKESINKPFFLKNITISELCNFLPIKFNNKKYFPIYFMMPHIEISDHKNIFFLGIGDSYPIHNEQQPNAWYMDEHFPTIPTKNNWEFDENDFLFYHNKIKGYTAIYTKNIELLSLEYEFYADSYYYKQEIPITDHYLDDRLKIVWKKWRT